MEVDLTDDLRDTIDIAWAITKYLEDAMRKDIAGDGWRSTTDQDLLEGFKEENGLYNGYRTENAIIKGAKRRLKASKLPAKPTLNKVRAIIQLGIIAGEFEKYVQDVIMHPTPIVKYRLTSNHYLLRYPNSIEITY